MEILNQILQNDQKSEWDQSKSWKSWTRSLKMIEILNEIIQNDQNPESDQSNPDNPESDPSKWSKSWIRPVKMIKFLNQILQNDQNLESDQSKWSKSWIRSFNDQNQSKWSKSIKMIKILNQIFENDQNPELDPSKWSKSWIRSFKMIKINKNDQNPESDQSKWSNPESDPSKWLRSIEMIKSLNQILQNDPNESNPLKSKMMKIFKSDEIIIFWLDLMTNHKRSWRQSMTHLLAARARCWDRWTPGPRPWYEYPFSTSAEPRNARRPLRPWTPLRPAPWPRRPHPALQQTNQIRTVTSQGNINSQLHWNQVMIKCGDLCWSDSLKQ